MFKFIFKLGLLFLCFSLEIQVSAKPLVVTSPESCTSLDEVCVVKNISKVTQNYNFENIKVRMSAGAIMRMSNDKIKLLKGEFIVKCTATCLLSSMYIDSIQINEGMAYIATDLSKDITVGLKGIVAQSIWGRGDFPLLPGMFQEVERGDTRGNKAELPQIIEENTLIGYISGLSEAPLALITDVRSNQEDTIELLSIQFKQSMERKIASDELYRYQQRQRKKRYDNESARLRRLFRKRNNL